jgi:hypothetical protein
MAVHSFTRSPYHALAFLVAFVAANDEQRSQIIAKLNSINAEMRFDESELMSLISQIEWASLLKKSVEEFDPMDFSFSPPAMDFSVNIATANASAFLEALARQSPQLSEALRTATSSIQISESKDKDSLSFITQIHEIKIWLEPFKHKSSNLFKVKNFALSSDLSDRIKALEEGAISTIGCFTICKGWGKAKDDIELLINAPLASVRGEQFLIKLEEKIESSPGIYAVFLGLKDYCGLPLVGKIRLSLTSKAEFSESGAGVFQEQSLMLGLGGGSAYLNKPTVITVESLDGVLFLDTAIAVKFSSEPAPAYVAEFKHYINLETKAKGEPVRLYPQVLGPQQALQAAVEYHDPAKCFRRELSSLFPQISFPWQAADASSSSTTPHGGAGQSGHKP